MVVIVEQQSDVTVGGVKMGVGSSCGKGVNGRSGKDFRWVKYMANRSDVEFERIEVGAK